MAAAWHLPVDQPPRAARSATPAKPANREVLSRALSLLSRRDLPRAAFIERLIAAGFPADDAAQAAAWCQAHGFLDDARYVEGAARRMAERYSASRVAHTLREKGADAAAIAAVLPALKETEVTRAHHLWQRRFGALPANPQESARQGRFLQSRGFGYAVIKRVWQLARSGEELGARGTVSAP